MLSKENLKEQLLEVSERLVDLSEELETAVESEDEARYNKLHRELRDKGDFLVEVIEIAEGDDLAYAQFVMGSLCTMLGYWGQAEESYRKALTHWPDHIGILNELFDALVQQKKYAPAKEIIEQRIKYGGETPIILQNYAAIMVHLHKLDEAKIIMMNCIAKFPDDQESRNFLHQLENPAGK